MADKRAGKINAKRICYGQASVNVGHYFFFRFFLLPCLFGLAGSFLGANALMAIDQESSSKTEEVASLKISGGVRYLSGSRAELRWESNLKGAAVVAYGVDKTLEPSWNQKVLELVTR